MLTRSLRYLLCRWLDRALLRVPAQRLRSSTFYRLLVRVSARGTDRRAA